MSLSELAGAVVSRRAILRGISAGVVAGTVGVAGRSGQAWAATSSSAPRWSALRQRMTGTLYVKGQSGYSAVAHGYDPRFDSVLPSAVARCVSSADVSAEVLFASTNAVPFTVRSGGHALSGCSTGAGLGIDTTPMSKVAVNSSTASATVGAGARLIDVYHGVSSLGFGTSGGHVRKRGHLRSGDGRRNRFPDPTMGSDL